MTARLHVRDRRTLWRRVDAVRLRLEGPAEKIIAKELRRERVRLLAEVDEAAGLVAAIWIDPEPWADALVRLWVGAGGAMWTMTVDEILTQFPEKQVDLTDLRDLGNNARGLGMIRRRVETIADRITQQTRRLLQREADQFDRTLRQSIREINRLGPARTRASRLARQQVLDATATLQQEAAVATERELAKEWLSRGDAQVRPTHNTADATYSGDGAIPLDEQFIVGGAPMFHPRDPAGPAKEVVNCRCQTRYIPAARVAR